MFLVPSLFMHNLVQLNWCYKSKLCILECRLQLYSQYKVSSIFDTWKRVLLLWILLIEIFSRNFLVIRSILNIMSKKKNKWGSNGFEIVNNNIPCIFHSHKFSIINIWNYFWFHSRYIIESKYWWKRQMFHLQNKFIIEYICKCKLLGLKVFVEFLY